MLNKNAPAVFTVCEVAKILRIGKLSVYQAITRGEIPCIRIGRRILIPRYALEQLLGSATALPGHRAESLVLAT